LCCHEPDRGAAALSGCLAAETTVDRNAVIRTYRAGRTADGPDCPSLFARCGPLNPPEPLIANLATEAGRCSPLHERIGCLVEQLDSRVEQLSQFHHLRHEFVRETAIFDTEASGRFDQLGNLRNRSRAKL